MDVVVATLLAILVLPLAIGITVLIVLTAGRPVLHRRTRVGRDGMPFTLLWFRTTDAEPSTRPLGRFLRRTGLDGLPQLLNVIRGDMSLIGPRSAAPEQLDGSAPRPAPRLAVRPGLTGRTGSS